MALNQLTSGWKLSSPAAKIGLVIAMLIVIGALIGGTVAIVHHFQDAAYQKREEQRETERQQWADEKKQLELEREQWRTKASEAEAVAEAAKQVATSKRADRVKIIKEIETVEAEHERKKQEAEQAGRTMSDTELVDALCAKFKARGMPCPD